MEREDVRRVIDLLGRFPGTKAERLAASLEAADAGLAESLSEDAQLTLRLLAELARVPVDPDLEATRPAS